jgi:hypothetical protein
LRPVSGWKRTIGWATGGRSRFSSSVAGLLPVFRRLASQLCTAFSVAIFDFMASSKAS